MLKRRKFLIGGLIICLAVGYLVYMGLGSSVTYYSTVSELVEKEDSIYGKNVRVNGEVAPDSVDWDPKSLILRFTIADEGESLPVIYQGVVPDAFKAGADVVVEGKLDSDGIFQANTLLTKCPSRYVPEE